MMTRRLFSAPVLWAVVLTLPAAPAARGQAPAASGQRALLVVQVHEEATLTVDDGPTKQKGAVRRFYSPPLEPGQPYRYTLVARWQPNNYETFTLTRKVAVEPGKTVEIDLRTVDPAQGDRLVIRYVPTPPEIVDAMMKLGNVGKGDVVYDLGCGDGRLVITAVKKFHADRGVGVDLDPERIRESKLNARSAGVEDRVQFLQKDVLKVSVSDATVVLLYMSDDLNLLVRPNLLAQLKPGTRVVSHRFTMGDWKPDKTQTLTGEDGEEYQIHLWTIKKK